MHNVGATQELQSLQSALHKRVTNLMANDERMDVLVEQIQQRMSQEADAQLLERNRIIEAEALRVRLESELTKAQFEQQRNATQIAAEQQRLTIEHNSNINRLKIQADADANTLHTKQQMSMQEESLSRREQLRLETETALQKARLDKERQLESERLETELELVKSEIAARALAERGNEDIELRRFKAQASDRHYNIATLILCNEL
jgi:Domain of unknown function (DUF3523)